MVSMAHNVKGWHLESVDPMSGNLAKVIPIWFKNSVSLKTHYKQVEEKLSSGRRSKLTRHLARCLLAVRLACYVALAKGYKSKQKPYETSFRWLLSCPPAGGSWSTPREALVCRNLFCPWCWLRRHDLLFRAVMASKETWISYHGRRIRGTGLGNRLYCLSFRAAGEGFYSSQAALNELQRIAALETAPFKKDRALLRVSYPMPGLKGATVAYLSNEPFQGLTSGTAGFPALPGGRLGIHVTAKPLLFSRLLASRMLWVPEMLVKPEAALRVIEQFRGKKLFTTSGGNDG